MAVNKPGLVAKDLEYRRDDRVLFSELNLEIQPGQAIQIEGSNGSGKTTLLRILCGLIMPDHGHIFWGDEDIQHNRHDYVKNLAYIGHHNGIKEDSTALENLILSRALSGTDARMSPNQALLSVGLRGYDHQLCRTLSAGQKRRVALARLLINPSMLWILDEPFTAIDQTGMEELEAIITEHVSAGGMVILTSHHKLNLTDLSSINLSNVLIQ